MALISEAHAYAAVPTDDTEQPPSPDVIAEDVRRANLGVATLMHIVRKKKSTIQVETGSVYGSVITLPQIARSAGWPLNLSLLALRSYGFLVINICVQATFLYMIAKEEIVMDKFAGQMNLCDFGASMNKCPDADGCVGPGGTKYTPSRLLPFDQWATRNFVRDSLKALFPEQEKEIDQNVDPGEYGLESYKCRILCCFLFMMSVTREMYQILDLVRLLYHVPTRSQPWITYEPLASSGKHTDRLKIKIAGIPLHWKLLNLVFVLLPKLALWKLTCQSGINFLLETSGMADVIANSVALGFILSVDELIFESITTSEARCVMDMLEAYDISEGKHDIHIWETEEQLLEGNKFSCAAAIPARLLIVALSTLFFVSEYYLEKCERGKDGTWVSKPMYLPRTVDYSALAFLFPALFAEEHTEKPFWTFASETED